jgi:hypothetical protein
MDDVLEELDRQIRRAEALGDWAAEGDARVRRAGALTTAGRLAEAIAELERAGPLFLKANRPAEQAGATWALAILVARDPARRDDARRLLHRVRALATLGARPDLVVKSQFRMAMLDAESGDLDAAANTLATLLEQATDARVRYDAHRARAGFYQALGRPDKALAELDAAVEEARATGDAKATLQARLERRVLQPFTVDARARETFAALLEEARAAGDPVLAGAVEIQRAGEALRADRAEEGEAAAQSARRAALAADDAVLYTLACLLVAEARELRADHAGVVAILLTCKATLEQRFGKEAGRPVVWVLQATERRWGKAAMDAALTEYRRRAKAGEV